MILATIMRSRKEEFTLLPVMDWWTGVPATSLTGTTLPGEEGQAMRGSRVERSISSCSS